MPVAITEPESASAISGPEPYRIPEDSWSERRVAALIFVLSFAYLCLFRHYTTFEPDEGIVLQGAQRILGGQMLYRDFFSFYTPGSYYLLALVFNRFGSSIAVARTVLAVFGATYAVMTYLLARRVCSRTTSVAIAAIVAFVTLPYRFLVLHNWDSTLWTCLAIYCAVRWLEGRHSSWAFATGSFTAITVLFEQSKGAGLFLGLTIGFLLLNYLDRRPQFPRTSLFALAAGFLWPIAVTITYFAGQHCFWAMLSDWTWPLQHYSAANRVPYGYQDWSESTRQMLFSSGPWWVRVLNAVIVSPCFLIPVLPLGAIGLLIYCIRKAWRHRWVSDSSGYYILITAAIAGLLLSIVITRADILHFMYLLPVFSLVLAWVMDGNVLRGSLLHSIRPAFNAYVAVAFFALAMAPLLSAAGSRYSILTRRGMITSQQLDQVTPYVQEKVMAGTSILVYPYLPLYYYLTGTFSPTKYDYFQPGMNTQQQSAGILAELASRRVDTVLFEPSFTEKIAASWPNTPLSAVVNDPVANYIVREYHTCKVLKSPSDWRFLFMVRKDRNCP